MLNGSATAIKKVDSLTLARKPLINLGCGTRPESDMWNVDKFHCPGVDEIVDLNNEWPFPDNSVSGFYACHTLEHLKDPINFFKEAQRCLVNKGSITVRVPHGNNREAWADPTHLRPYFPESFNAFTKGYGVDNTYCLQQTKDQWSFKFVITRIEINMSQWVKKLPFWKFYYKFLEKYVNDSVGEIFISMQKQED